MVLLEDQTPLPNGFRFSINDFPYEPPTVPVLLQILSGAKKASDLLPAGSIYGLDANKSVEITIPGGSKGGPVSVQRVVVVGRPLF